MRFSDILTAAACQGGGRIIVPTTFNPADKSTGVNLSGGNLVATGTATGSYENVRTTAAKSTGKWYWEGLVTAAASNVGIGIANNYANFVVLSHYLGIDANSMGWYGSGFGGPSAFVINDVLSLALDLTNNKLWYAKNGVFTGDPATNTGGNALTMAAPVFAAFSADTAGLPSLTIRFLPASFSYSPPTGFSGWDT